jgi:threonine/homoserine/homoserine lactone efflux protein
MSYLSLFSIGFIMGLTGAMAPGPLLTVTIGESAKRGGIVGPMVVLGHGILEFVLLLLIVFGLGNALNNKIVFTIIALAGGIILIYMGYAAIKNLKNYRLSYESVKEQKGMHPILSGIVISLSNPYWFIWWITVGMGYIIFAQKFGIYGIIAFFAGHILSDLVWYSFISYGIQFGGKYMNVKVIKAILFVCSLFLIVFGIFFIFKGFGVLAAPSAR